MAESHQIFALFFFFGKFMISKSHSESNLPLERKNESWFLKIQLFSLYWLTFKFGLIFTHWHRGIIS